MSAAAEVALSQTPSVIPSEATDDFSAVNLYDMSGPTTYPIVMISYFYVEHVRAPRAAAVRGARACPS